MTFFETAGAALLKPNHHNQVKPSLSKSVTHSVVTASRKKNPYVKFKSESFENRIKKSLEIWKTTIPNFLLKEKFWNSWHWNLFYFTWEISLDRTGSRYRISGGSTVAFVHGISGDSTDELRKFHISIFTIQKGRQF